VGPLREFLDSICRTLARSAGSRHGGPALGQHPSRKRLRPTLSVARSARRAKASKDCLFLNEASQDNLAALPVMDWIHGSSLVTRKNNDFDPTPLIQRGNVVVVTNNCRLGALGLAFSDLTAVGSPR
jgi:carboxylesterase type B